MENDPNLQIVPQPIPDGTRRNTQASTRLLHEWAQMQPWESPPSYELRLGPTTGSVSGVPLSPALEAMLRRRNHYADLVGLVPHELLVIEAKVVIDAAAIGQLEWYMSLISSTPALRNYLDRLIVPVLLVAVDDEQMRMWALGKGIRVVTYAPSWIENYLVQKYYRRRQINAGIVTADEQEG